jgi:hypothetical protein
VLLVPEPKQHMLPLTLLMPQLALMAAGTVLTSQNQPLDNQRQRGPTEGRVAT